MSHAVVTGGAGFIGRWVVARLLADGWSVVVLDDLSSGRAEQLDGLGSVELIEGSIEDEQAVARAFSIRPDLCLHLAASINVQHSIDDPAGTFVPDVLGTLNVLEQSRAAGTTVLFMSSCMVYAPAVDGPIGETHPIRPASPYAASKLAGESLALSYGLSYGLPVSVVRPFNTYGPFQRADGEGGVVSIFCDRARSGAPIDVFGDGTQTRDLLYVEDCADFVVRAALDEAVHGEIVNAGTGRDVTINELAELIGDGRVPVRHVEHPHPQAEIARLVCDPSKAERLLGWEPKTSLAGGIARTSAWLAAREPAEK